MPETFSELQNAIVSSDIPKLVLSVMQYAVELNSSDIHIEPSEYTVRIRFRVDGVLREIVEYPPKLHSAVASRIKIISNLKIDESRIPQDGRTRLNLKNGEELDLRVSTLPTIFGEKIVMRIQNINVVLPKLEDLGMEGYNLEVVSKAIHNPNGIILATGPTGSGKTTTLYACLNAINTPAVNIMTIEDPIEIYMDGLNQSQVRPDIGYTFAFGLRTGLRQDPDIMMVGEIRDKETIDVAIEAALTGHLVFSTIHTNSAVATITRILDMHIPNFLITSTINTIIAQRLVRKICEHCKVETTVQPAIEQKIRAAIAKMNDQERQKLKIADNAPLKIYKGEGCEHCGSSGYQGRMGLFEVLALEKDLKKMILGGASEQEIEEAAIAAGMKTLEQDGIVKILKGLTTPEEIYRVVRYFEQ